MAKPKAKKKAANGAKNAASVKKATKKVAPKKVVSKKAAAKKKPAAKKAAPQKKAAPKKAATKKAAPKAAPKKAPARKSVAVKKKASQVRTPKVDKTITNKKSATKKKIVAPKKAAAVSKAEPAVKNVKKSAAKKAVNAKKGKQSPARKVAGKRVGASKAKAIAASAINETRPAKAVAPARPKTKVIVGKIGRTRAPKEIPEMETMAGRLRAGHNDGSSSGPVPTEAQLRRASERQYMNDGQLTFFRARLMQMRAEVLGRELDVKERLHQREIFADPADRASAEEEHWLDLRLRERESLLLKKIDEALRRIRDKEYGYCEKTGEPIGIARLLARPTATVCVDVKGQDERAESQFRDR